MTGPFVNAMEQQPGVLPRPNGTKSIITGQQSNAKRKYRKKNTKTQATNDLV